MRLSTAGTSAAGQSEETTNPSPGTYSRQLSSRLSWLSETDSTVAGALDGDDEHPDKATTSDEATTTGATSDMFKRIAEVSDRNRHPARPGNLSGFRSR